MLLAVTETRADNSFGLLIYNYLALERMSLLFPRIKMFLLVVPIFDSLFSSDPFF